MATKKKLALFDDYEDQETKDLKYGGQKDACKKLIKKKDGYVDPSFSGDWTVEED